jgi:hypothetical protein
MRARATPCAVLILSLVVPHRSLQDDMEVSSDFIAFMTRITDVVDRDSSIFAVSSWNGNPVSPLLPTPGWPGLPHDDTLEGTALSGKRHGVPVNVLRGVARANFVRLLGWLLPLRTWKQVQHRWPSDRYRSFLCFAVVRQCVATTTATVGFWHTRCYLWEVKAARVCT